MKYLAIGLACLLAGCSIGTATTSTGDTSVSNGAGTIFDARTKDGVQCVVMVGSYKGGLDCNWEEYNAR